MTVFLFVTPGNKQVLPSITGNPDVDAPFYFFLILATVVLGAFLLTILDEGKGPFFNAIASFWQKVFLKITGKPFTIYPIFFVKKLSPDQRQILFNQLVFYKHLSRHQRLAFDNRVVRFMRTRQFETREYFTLNEEMKLLISATAVQISFGLRSFMVREFSKIIVYPERYFNHQQNAFHKGEVNPRGVVVLSWNDFEKGMAIPDDSLHVGIHEFAHTLAIQRLRNKQYSDFGFVQNFDKLMRSISHPVFRKRIQERAGLRTYALTNAMEFFAVATEAFFENPELLYRNHMGIYNLFAEMYNQDLLALYKKPVVPLTKLKAYKR